MRVFLIFIFLYRFPEHARSNCGPETGKKVNLINSNSEALVKVIALHGFLNVFSSFKKQISIVGYWIYYFVKLETKGANERGHCIGVLTVL